MTNLHFSQYFFPIIGFFAMFWWAKVILVDTIRRDNNDEAIGAGYILSIIVGIVFAIVFYKMASLN